MLLIAAALTDEELSSYVEVSRGMTLQPLVEVHDSEEMQRAIDAGSDLMGINNRNLKTFETTLDTTYQLVGMSPSHCTLVSESGIKTAEDVLQLKDAGVQGVKHDRGLRFNHISLAIDAAIDGQGVLLGLKALAENDIEAGRLCIPFPQTMPIEMSYYAIYPESTESNRHAVESFIKWILEETESERQ